MDQGRTNKKRIYAWGTGTEEEKEEKEQAMI